MPRRTRTSPEDAPEWRSPPSRGSHAPGARGGLASLANDGIHRVYIEVEWECMLYPSPKRGPTARDDG